MAENGIIPMQNKKINKFNPTSFDIISNWLNRTGNTPLPNFGIPNSGLANTGLNTIKANESIFDSIKTAFNNLFGGGTKVPVSNYKDLASADLAFRNAQIDSLNSARNFNNSWLGGKGLAALQGIGSIADIYTGIGAYRQNRKNSKLQREIARWNFNQAKEEYSRLKGNRKGLTQAYSQKRSI